jgi:hypothetical protein
MNKRFQELHNQARDFYLQDEYLDVSTKELHRLVEQKFAELIIRDCMEICYRTDTEYEGKKVKPAIIASKVATHFGVEQ